jgi:hypothetical protein
VWTRAVRRTRMQMRSSRLAMEDPSLLATAFAEAVAASGLDADDSPIAAPTAGLNDDAKWDKYPLVQQPGENARTSLWTLWPAACGPWVVPWPACLKSF